MGNDQHHREQQDDGREIDCAQGVLGAHDAEGDHEHGADDRSAGPIDFQAGELPQREYAIASQEDEISSQNAGVGEDCWVHRLDLYLGRSLFRFDESDTHQSSATALI